MKKLFLGSLVVAIVLGAIAWYQLRDASDSSVATSTPPAEVSPDEAVQTVTVSAGTESFRALIAKPGNLECTITTEGDVRDSMTGTYFATGGNVRADLVVVGATPNSPESNVTSVVIKDETLFTWAVIEGESYGLKTKLGDVLTMTADSPERQPGKQTPIGFDEAVTYDCKPWEVVDGSIFEPPSTILFKEYASTIEAGMEYGTVYPETRTGAGLSPEDIQSGDPCALCAKVAPGDGQDQCRVNFKCKR